VDITCFLSKVPDVVWAAVIASLLTLGGVWLTNRGNNKRLLDQLQHDAAERARERQMSLRREVYLKAAEAISKAYTILMGLPQADLQSTAWKADVNAISESLMKVHVVGTDDTVASITRFSSEFSKALIELSEKRLPLDQLKARIDTLSNLMNGSAQERDRYIAMMKEFNLMGLTDQRLWDTIQHNYEFENKRNQEYADEHAKILQQHGVLLMNLMKDGYQKVIEIGHVLVPALCAVRNEMDIPIDANRYRQLMEETRAEMEGALNHFIDNIQSKLKV
jgi:hypothetical protein